MPVGLDARQGGGERYRQAAMVFPSTMNPAALRILHLNSMLTGGGTDDQSVKLCLGLHKLGQKVSLFGPDGREFSKIVRQLGVPFQAAPPEGPLKLRFIACAAKFIRRERVQVVHGHHGRDFWPTVLAARLSGCRPKIVVTRHMAKSPGSGFSRRFLLGQCTAVVAVSNFVARVLRDGVYEPDSPEPERRRRPPMQGAHAKIQVIHGGIDTDLFRPGEAAECRAELGLKPADYAFAVVGGYDLPRGKGQREFLQSAARMHEQSPRARFLIIGRGNMAEILKQDITRLGLNSKAWLTPYFAGMPQVMNAIDCLVHPQIGTEAFGLVVCEAHACGKPVIASALDGIPEAFAAGNLGQLVTPESVDELSAALLAWANRPAFAMGERRELHRRIAEKFSVQTAARNVLQLYRALVDGMQPRAGS
jgi:glycosyltransferase involved in cell wall biosynthesis